MPKFAWICVGAALLYTGGMFLNDAVDADWDRKHRPERPIPAERISRGSVYAGALGFLVAGWLLLLVAGGRSALLGALAITGYVAGLSFLARRESTDHRMPRWPVLLLFAPVGMALVERSGAVWPLSTILAGAMCLLWTAWCLRHTVGRPPPNIGRCVSGLLAGIPLADGLAAAGGSWLLTAGFGGLFLFAGWWQRFAPAT